MKKKSLRNLGEKGRLGEGLAVNYLVKKGLKLLKRNFHSRFGEIDLIFQDKDTLIFVEVKTRFSKKYGKPEEAVNKRKIETIIKTGEYFRILHPNTPLSLRIDIISILLEPETNKLISLKHFGNVTKYM